MLDSIFAISWLLFLTYYLWLAICDLLYVTCYRSLAKCYLLYVTWFRMLSIWNYYLQNLFSFACCCTSRNFWYLETVKKFQISTYMCFVICYLYFFLNLASTCKNLFLSLVVVRLVIFFGTPCNYLPNCLIIQFETCYITII